MLRTQETLDGEIIVDSFAGGGGASTGIELALGRIVNVAINHDPAAIRMHEANHPYTEHYQASVWDVDPETVCRGRPVALAWFSPDCKHFSKAKGAALVDRKIRGLAWIVLRWAPFIVDCNHSGGGHVTDSQEPCKTITAKHTGDICRPVLTPLTMTNTSNSAGAPAAEPMNTVRTGGGGGQMLLSPSLIQYHTEKTESARAAGLDKPVCTVDASNRYGLTCANLVEYYGGGRPLDVQSPMHTVTSHDREAVVAAHVVKYYSGVDGEKAGEPLPTVTAIDHNAVCAAHVVKYKRDEVGTRPSEPLPTQTAGGVFGCCKAVLYKISTSERLHHWPQIRDLLNLYCGYALGEDDLLLLSIGGAPYYIADIGLRMLSPRELYNAMGFPPDYIIDHDAAGKPYPKTQQVARCGNAVCPPMAAAVVAANLPEYAMPGKIETMAALADAVAM